MCKQGASALTCRCLVDDHIADTAAGLPDELHGHLFRLTAGSAVADGDMGDAVAADQLGKLGDAGFFLLTFIG